MKKRFDYSNFEKLKYNTDRVDYSLQSEIPEPAKKKRKVAAKSDNKEKEKSVDSGESNAVNNDDDVPLKRRLRDRPKTSEKDVRKSGDNKENDEDGKKSSKKVSGAV